MPSKRRERRREDELLADGWFRITEELWTEPGEIPQKLRVVADANFPAGLVELMEGRNIDVKTAQSLGLERFADEDLLQRVKADGRVLITLDRDFWSDEKFPLHQSGGVIFVDGKDEGIGHTLGFELLLAYLASYGGGWSRLKFRASSERLYMKGISWTNRRFIYEIRDMRGGVYARGAEGVDE